VHALSHTPADTIAMWKAIDTCWLSAEAIHGHAQLSVGRRLICCSCSCIHQQSMVTNHRTSRTSSTSVAVCKKRWLLKPDVHLICPRRLAICMCMALHLTRHSAAESRQWICAHDTTGADMIIAPAACCPQACCTQCVLAQLSSVFNRFAAANRIGRHAGVTHHSPEG
jgi:hypothetical protein